jgi:twitching motility protein PilU
MSQDLPNDEPSCAIHPTLAQMLLHMDIIGASDLYVTKGCAPVFRVDGVGCSGRVQLDAAVIDEMALSVMTPEQQEEFRASMEMNLAVALSEESRFRINIFRQRGATGMVARRVQTRVPTLDQLALPSVLRDVAMSKRGLVLVVGGTGSGKSTTLAAMINERNEAATGHIVTVEDPIEFIHPHRKCVVTQREVGVDTTSYHRALKNALRQAPDVILVGEIRDAAVMEAAIEFAETGHLCVSTLHSNNASQALERVLNFFPPTRMNEIRMQLSLNLRAIVSQRLVPAIGGGRAAALEVLLDTPRIRDLIKRGEIDLIRDAMEQSAVDGCATFDSALLALCLGRRVSAEEALRNSDRPNDFRLRLERATQSGASEEVDADKAPLRLAEGKYGSPQALRQAARVALAGRPAAAGASR